MFSPGFWIPIAALAFGTIIVVSVLFFGHQRRKLWHETARVALEKGQPLPTQLEKSIQSSADGKQGRGPAHDVRSALILLAIAVGLYIGLGGLDGGRGPQLLGAYICGGIGIALLLNALIAALFFSKSSDVSSGPPQT